MTKQRVRFAVVERLKADFGRIPHSAWWLLALLPFCVIGCGRVVAQKATDQLIAGDAVDRTVSQIDFRLLSGKKIYLDTQYIPKNVPGVGFVTADYIVSSVRQKLMGDGCLLQEKMDQADFVVEMRIGALGADDNEVIYGMPQNNYLSLASGVVQAPGVPSTLPSIPEISLGKKDHQMAAAKIALFAYNRATREPIWQSGVAEYRSRVDNRWYLGAGPFHKGNIYHGKNQDHILFGDDDDGEERKEYFVERRFADPTKSLASTPPATAPPAAKTPAAAPPASTTAVAATAAPDRKHHKDATAAAPIVQVSATTATTPAATVTNAAASVPAPAPATVSTNSTAPPPAAATNSTATSNAPAPLPNPGNATSATGPPSAPQVVANPKTS